MAVGLAPETFISPETIDEAPDVAAEVCREGIAAVVDFRRKDSDPLMTSINNMDVSKPGNAAIQGANRYFVMASRWRYASSERREELGYWQ